ncbi:MAG TPA: hypothetical protein GXX40_08225 [Firmicutes bacterium]|nr:hypothetical protein [Bacillota bacterium]
MVFDQSTISKHLAVLKSAGILMSTKQGATAICERNIKCVYGSMKCIERLQAASLDLVTQS